MSASEASLRARGAIFSRLREAAAGKPVAAPDVAAYFAQRAAPPPQESRCERFVRNARSWRAEVIEAAADGWQQALGDMLGAAAAGTVLLGRGTPIGAAAAASLPAPRLRWYDGDLADFKPELFSRIDTGLTTTIGAVAETGSLLLWPTIAEPRTISLVPPLHIAVLFESRIHETLFDAMREQNWAERMPSNLLLVTGPSKTADIQRMLVYGAHGPKALKILLVRDLAPETAQAGGLP